MAEWVTPTELAKELKVSKPLPYQWAKQKLLRHYKFEIEGEENEEGEIIKGKIIRFKREDVDAFIEKWRVEGK